MRPRRKARAGSSKTRKHTSFVRAVVRITAAIHVPVALAMTGGARLLGLDDAGLVGTALALVLFGLFPSRARRLFPDRPRSRWELHLVDEPYFAHFSAALGAAIPIALVSVLVPLVQLLGGRTIAFPFEATFFVYLFFLAVAAWGVFIRRRWVEEREIEVPIAGLPEAFDGYRIAHLSDLHVGGFTPRRVFEKWFARANAKKPDLVAVTGDMVTSGTAFHEDIAEVIGQLETKDGVIVAMGNHDYFGEGEPLVGLLRDKGAYVLRNEGLVIERNGQRLLIAGVDDNWSRRDNLEKALRLRDAEDTTVLLAHDPVMFEEARRAGVELTLSGHTHGGQVAMPFFAKKLSLAQLTHKHFLGLYREGESAVYVNAGLGTTGPPLRLGVPPEIAVLVLRAAPRHPKEARLASAG